MELAGITYLEGRKYWKSLEPIFWFYLVYLGKYLLVLGKYEIIESLYRYPSYVEASYVGR